jgi:hypothetical protein
MPNGSPVHERQPFYCPFPGMSTALKHGVPDEYSYIPLMLFLQDVSASSRACGA